MRALGENNRYTIRIAAAEEERLMRAASIEQTNIEDFILRSALKRAEFVIRRAEHILLSEHDTSLWFDLLDNPPEPNARLIAAAKALQNDR